MDMHCWNGFCIAGPHVGDEHVDFTGDAWVQPRGTTYCPVCHAYTVCDHKSPVVTIYER